MKKEKSKDRAADQPNLFGEQDQVYNTIQEEITIVIALAEACEETISKKEDQLEELWKRKRKLDKAAATVAKLRDAGLKKKGKEEKKGASWPKEKK